MKRKTRVTRGRKVASLRASEGAEHGRSTNDGERWQRWRNEYLELGEWRKLPKKRVTINLDADVLAWFRGMGRGYQWEMNRALRRVMEEEKKG